jgi:FdrA protein
MISTPLAAHPMIDPSLRNQLIAELGEETQVGVLLLDVVIGYGATADPAESLVEACRRAWALRVSAIRCTLSPR